MRERLLAFVEAVKDFWNKTSKKMRIIYLVMAMGILGVSLGIVILLNQNDYVVLYDGLSTGDSAAVMASLQEMDVDYVLEGDRILVDKKDEMSVRMQIATQNYSGGLDYGVFANGSSLTATQFEKEQYLVYQTQDRLQTTIETFPEVNSAIVNISMPDNDVFVLQTDRNEPTASVKLQVKPGKELTSQQIQGIINIVKHSVSGLREENISVADQNGDLRGTLLSGQDAASTKLALTEQVNETFKRRILSMFGDVYGDRIRVGVNAVLDTNQKIIETNEYTPLDPENPTNNPLDYDERFYEGTGRGGAAQGVPGAENNVDVPQYGVEDGEMGENEYYSSHVLMDYLVGSVRSQIIDEGLDITDMTIAVLIDTENLSDSERDKIVDIITKTAGVTADKVSVQGIAFDVSAAGETPDGAASQSNWLVWLFVGIAVVALIAIIVMVIISLRKRKQREEEELLAMEGSTLIDLMGQDEEFEPITIPETNEQKLKAQIKDLADSDPEIVAQLIKTWLLST